MSSVDTHVDHNTEIIPLKAIFGTTIALVVFLLVVFALTFYGLLGAIPSEKESKSLTHGSRTLNELNKKEDVISNEYRELKGGKYRIPVDKAMELVIKESQ
jgi:hypothetical protein